jgi:hypothetical protein
MKGNKGFLLLTMINLALLIISCSSTKQSFVTVYGKTSGNLSKSLPDIYTDGVTYRVDDIYVWPDSMLNKYVKISGELEKQKVRKSRYRQRYTINWISNYTLSVLEHDSIKDAIDSTMNKCAQLRKFAEGIQKNHLFDSVFTGDTIYIRFDERLTQELPHFHYRHKDFKNIRFVSSKFIDYFKPLQYLEMPNYNCIESDYFNVEMFMVHRCDDNLERKKYYIVGNRDKLEIVSS